MTQASDHLEPHDASIEAERLFGRVIDLQAAPEDMERFRRLLADDERAWLLFNDAYQGHTALLSELADVIRRVDGVELPAASVHERPVRRRFSSRSLGLGLGLGWVAAAAMLVLTVFLPPRLAGPSATVQPTLHHEHEAHVRDVRPSGLELDPVFLNVRERPDGRWEVTIIRRSAETLLLDEWRQEWIQRDAD